MSYRENEWEVSTQPTSFIEIQARKEFFETLPLNVRAIFKEQIESAKKVLNNPEAYSDAELIAKANSLKEIQARIEIGYQANESAKATQEILKKLW
ncbi:hypothetical protein AAGS61_04200 [Lysinibacillus sp. KU-BSD001]|uniref:hypothetical protein n=1 Tax=Lysinibacillus sp. KU-BSD001 TaxID=3141328 RepID=UPI0036E4B8F1